MNLFALIIALMLEQFSPLATRKKLQNWLFDYADFFQHHLNAGKYKHGRTAWLLAVLPLLVAVLILSFLLHNIHPIFSWMFNVFVLYLSLGFRQYSFYFTDIHQELHAGNLDEARKLLTVWRGMPAHELNAKEVARVSTEEALLTAHRTLFGSLVWFVLFGSIGLGGAVGALLYRLGQILCKRWAIKNELELAEFGRFAQQAFCVLDWLPVRITALVFAIVGNFEDTIYCWRTQAVNWTDKQDGIVLASGAGSLGVRLGMAIPQGGQLLDRAELGVGKDADVELMQSTIGLISRSAVLMLIVLLLIALVRSGW